MVEQSEHLQWMQQAYRLARLAAEQGEVPVGAVIVKDDRIIAKGWNQPLQHSDPTAHAEIVAMRQAAQQLGNYRLLDCTLYATLEPCVMCVGALVHARLAQVVFAALDPKAGAVCSQLRLLEQPLFNHRVSWKSGVMAEECGHLLKQFFKERR